MNVVAIVQARMNSTRLPGKVLMELSQKPVLGHVIERLSYCRMINQTVVATSSEASDDPIARFCDNHGIHFYRGSLDDVLDRYYRASQIFQADAIVRITSDCPVIDPVVVDAVISGYRSGSYDLFGLAGEFPDGLDCTVFSYSAIKRAWREATLKSEREHVGPYIENNPGIFKMGGLNLFHGLGNLRWTLDEPNDYKLLRKIFEELYSPVSPFYTHHILDLLKKKPHLIKINSQIIRNAGYIKSLKDDGESQ